MYGMKLSQLTPELVDEILDLYCVVCEIPKNSSYSIWSRNISGWTGAWHLEHIQQALNRSNACEWRYGSGLPGRKEDHDEYDRNAKLFIWYEEGIYENDKRVDVLIRFSFDPNIVTGEKAENMKDNFRVAVENLLQEKGLAVELERLGTARKIPE